MEEIHFFIFFAVCLIVSYDKFSSNKKIGQIQNNWKGIPTFKVNQSKHETLDSLKRVTLKTSSYLSASKSQIKSLRKYIPKILTNILTISKLQRQIMAPTQIKQETVVPATHTLLIEKQFHFRILIHPEKNIYKHVLHKKYN